MNHNNVRKKWIVTPTEQPEIIRRCPKCGRKTEFINSGKFRVNANGRLIDVWLIYRCKQCETSLNLTIYERVEAGILNPTEYERFLKNDASLAVKYGNDREVFIRNKAELADTRGEYQVEVVDTTIPCTPDYLMEIEMEVPACYEIRMDVLLAKKLSVSRSKIQKWCKEGLILSSNKTVESKCKVKSGMFLQIKPNIKN